MHPVVLLFKHLNGKLPETLFEPPEFKRVPFYTNWFIMILSGKHGWRFMAWFITVWIQTQHNEMSTIKEQGYWRMGQSSYDGFRWNFAVTFFKGLETTFVQGAGGAFTSLTPQRSSKGSRQGHLHIWASTMLIFISFS